MRLLPGEDVGVPLAPYRGPVEMTPGSTGTSSNAHRGGMLSRVRAEGTQVGRIGDWFAPTGGVWQWIADGLVATALGVVQVVGTIVYSQGEPSPWDLDAFAGVLLLAGPLALLLRRRLPTSTLVITFAATAGYVASGYPRGPAGFPAFAFGAVNAIVVGRRAAAWAILGIAYLAFLGLPLLVPDGVQAAQSFTSRGTQLAWLPLVGAVSELVRIGLERRIERAEAQREEARRRDSEERLQMARELHDVLAHHLSLISVQSGVALHLLDERPEQVRTALEAINGASDDALAGLRSVLDVVGGDVGGGDGLEGSNGRAPRVPTAGISDLPGLVRRTRAAGRDVRLVVDEDVATLPTAVDLAAFRVVQEALTNVVRHAGRDASSVVRITYTPTALAVSVEDDGAGRSTTARGPEISKGTGRGIAGMRERVQALGGTFAAGPSPGGGFHVRARFPLSQADR